MKVTFHHITGSKKGRSESFAGAKVKIGRDPGNDLTFDAFQDRDASGHHAEVLFENGQFLVQDVGSTNGTYVNGERISRKSLQEGDVISFGRAGPKVRFGVNPTSGSLPAPPAGHEVGPKTMKLILQGAIAKARDEKHLVGGTAAFIREVVRQSVSESTARVRLLVAASIAVFVLLFGFAGWLGWRLWSKSGELDERERLLTSRMADIDETLKARARKQQESFDQLEREADLRWKAKIAELEKQINDAKLGQGARDVQIKELEEVLKRVQGAGATFKAMAARSAPAVYLVFTQVPLRRKSNAPPDLVADPPRPMQFFGTGFCVSEDGWVVTNKHVVKPWLFPSEEKAILDEKYLEPDTDPVTGEPKVTYALWQTGAKVSDGSALSFATAYHNVLYRNLALEKCAPDEMGEVTEDVERADGSVRRVKFFAHQPNSLNDVALLKITEQPGVKLPFLELASDDDLERLRKGGALDDVLVLGFPRGTQVLEEGKATLSPTTGHIRKFERTIHIDASIGPGNSGGPVLNLEGKVIGIATRIMRGAETHGMCIPASEARKLLPK
ncbi:MAG: trypsin-like peptidase domain-containing protein [Planctomycetales bacterium]|nr:trypsin-like peptidase domain-containing protein [Planctomycetales bacterium]